MADFNCPKCISPIVVSDKINNEIKEVVASTIRNSGGRFDGVEPLKNIGIGLSEAKGIILHVTSQKGKCHHCTAELLQAEGNCTECGRLNFDW
jgi:hypothetical protein